MEDKYVLHSFSELMLDPGMERAQPFWRHRPCESCTEAFQLLSRRDHRTYFRDVAWNNGFIWTYFRASITSPKNELVAVRYSLLDNYGPEFPAGAYLYFNPKAVSFEQLEDTGLYLSCYKRIGEQGETMLLATKQELEKKDRKVNIFHDHKRIKYRDEKEPNKIIGPIRI